MDNIIVFGASKGLGKAIYDQLSQQGRSVIGASRSPSSDVVCDVTRYSHVLIAKRKAEEIGPCRLVINCAAVIEPISLLHTSPPTHWVDAASSIMAGCYNVMRAFIPTMMERSSGTIVNVSSGAGKIPINGWSAYCAGKASVEMLTKCARLENPDLNILSIDPGVIDTEMQKKIRRAGLGVVAQREFLQSPETAAQRILDEIEKSNQSFPKLREAV